MNRRHRAIGAITTMGTAALTLMIAAATPATAQVAVGVQQGGVNPQSGVSQQGSAYPQANPGPAGQFAMPRMGPPALTLATVPVSAMIPYFDLTEEQARQIDEIQKSVRPDRDAIRAQIEEARGQSGTPPTAANRQNMQAQMMAMRQKMQDDQDKAAREIGKILTTEQRPGITRFLRDVALFQSVGLPLELIQPLDLNGPQKSRLQTIARQAEQERQQAFMSLRQNRIQTAQGAPNGNGAAANDPAARQQQMQQFGQQIGEAMRTTLDKTREKVLAVLTPEQADLLAKWEKDHPNSQRSSRGFGPGGPSTER